MVFVVIALIAAIEKEVFWLSGHEDLDGHGL
jgi:hypothetical protein